jgi:hypothetical protein
MCIKCGKLVNCKYKKDTPAKKTPRNRILLVIQEGGSTGEVYVHAHKNVKDARADMKSCGEAAYRTVGPIEIPKALTEALSKNNAAEQEFYDTLENILRSVAQEF